MMFSLLQPATISISFDVLFSSDWRWIVPLSQVHQAADRKDADEEAGQLAHSGPRQEEAQGDSGQAQGKTKPIE